MPLDGNKHIGHRERLKERFIKDGIDGFEEHVILEMLLFYTIPQRDTNELAHTLLDRFGCLEQIINADVEELKQINGVGDYTARFLSMLSTLTDSYITDRRQNEIVSGIRNITEFAVRKLALLKTECLLILFIDNKQCMLSWHYLQSGMLSPDELNMKELVRMVMGTNTTHVLIARNCVRDKCKLSRNDMRVASGISDALHGTGAMLFDYMVVDRDRSIVTLKGNADIDINKGNHHSKAGDTE